MQENVVQHRPERVGCVGVALRILQSGKAEEKLREIIGEQGGDPDVKPDDIPIGRKVYNHKSKATGRVMQIIDDDISIIARKAGSPKDKEAGVYLWKKTGDIVKRGETLVTIYSKKGYKLRNAVDELERLKPYVVRTKGGVRRG